MLKNLLPSFPTGISTLDTNFWARGWCVIEEADYRILVLNSTADFPDYPSGALPESDEMKAYLAFIDRGGLAPGVEAGVRTYLESAPEKLNIALLHHHPIEHQLRAHLQDGYGPMRRGGEVIDILTRSAAAGRWLVIHGHKHIPQLVSATTTSANGPIVLCSASLGAKIWDPLDTVARNQFHVVDVQFDASNPNIGLCGTVESYTWGVGVGWYLSDRTGSGLPGLSGFGAATEPRLIAARIDALIPPSPGAFVPIKDVVAVIPELPFLLPDDWVMLEDFAGAAGVIFTRNRRQRMVSVGREVTDV